MSTSDMRAFLEHTSEDDRRDAQFVLGFTSFDANTKVRTDELPDVNLTAVFEVLDYFFPSGTVIW